MTSGISNIKQLEREYLVCSTPVTVHSLQCVSCLALVTVHSLQCLSCPAPVTVHSLQCLSCPTPATLHSLQCLSCPAPATVHSLQCLSCPAPVTVHSLRCLSCPAPVTVHSLQCLRYILSCTNSRATGLTFTAATEAAHLNSTNVLCPIHCTANLTLLIATEETCGTCTVFCSMLTLHNWSIFLCP